MNISTIKSYLVGLGFQVDHRGLNQFNEGLKKAATTAGEAIGGITKGFLVAGATVSGVLASIAAGTVGLMDHVAQGDLDMQVFARRMYMSTDAARKMKMATDALGYSVEEILWGPPELQERFQQLMKDENKMLEALGGADFEKQMRGLRDIRFEFTRLGLGLQVFSMVFVKDLSKALWGDENAFRNKLESFVNWFEEKLPGLAQSLATQVAPAFHELGLALGELWKNLSKVDWITLTNNVIQMTTEMVKLLSYIVSHPALAKMLLGAGAGAVGGGVLGSVIPGVGTVAGAGAGAIAGAVANIPLPHKMEDWINSIGAPSMQTQARRAAAQIARSLGVDPSWVYGQFVHETGGFTNRGALDLNNLAGIKEPGGKDYRKFSSVQEFADYYTQLLRNPRYSGAAGAKTDAEFFRYLKQGGYFEDSYDNYLSGARRGESGYNPISYHQSISVGDINVMQPNATPEQIHHAVKTAVKTKMDQQNQWVLAQKQGVFA